MGLRLPARGLLALLPSSALRFQLLLNRQVLFLGSTRISDLPLCVQAPLLVGSLDPRGRSRQRRRPVGCLGELNGWPENKSMSNIRRSNNY
jgi:hypothetical protein